MILKATCKRVRPNNGIIEALFTSNAGGKEEHVIVNVEREDPVQFERGKRYRITIVEDD